MYLLEMIYKEIVEFRSEPDHCNLVMYDLNFTNNQAYLVQNHQNRQSQAALATSYQNHNSGDCTSGSGMDSASCEEEYTSDYYSDEDYNDDECRSDHSTVYSPMTDDT
jgi:hypothetical protein